MLPFYNKQSVYKSRGTSGVVSVTASMNGDSATYTITTKYYDEDPDPDPCFWIETPIWMKNGSYKNIDQLIVGDVLRGFTTPTMLDESVPGWMDWTDPDLNSGSIEDATVTNIYQHTHQGYYLINNALKVTGNHPFLIFKDSLWQWVLVKDMASGDIMLGGDGGNVSVTSHTFIDEPLDVIALGVESVDTYFAKGSDGITILAHNK